MARKKSYIVLATLAGVLAFGYFVRSPDTVEPPELALNLSNEISVADSEFRSRVYDKFKLPVQESYLVQQLQEDGFEPSVSGRMASFSMAKKWCTLVWFINWDTFDGEVTRLETQFGARCLQAEGFERSRLGVDLHGN